MFERILELLKKEFIQIFRDPRMRPIIFIAPVLQLLLFGYVLNLDVNNINLGILDRDKTYESRNFISYFEASPYFTMKVYAGNEKELQDALVSGRISVGVTINSGFQTDLKSSKPATVQTIVDGSISNIASVVMAYTSQVVNNYNTQIMRTRYYRNVGLIQQEIASRFPRLGFSGLDARIRAIYNSDLESKNFYVPCVIALLIMVMTLLLTSMAIVKEKEVGTMEQLIVTPITSYELIIGKTIPFALIALFDMALVMALGILFFKVPIYGNIGLLFLGAILYIMCGLSIGLLVSIISKTQQQAMMTTFLILFPLLLMSGFMFPIENMPEFFQYVTYLNPLRYFIIIIRGIFLKGTDFSILWPQFLGLFILAMTLFSISVKKFSKKLG